MNFLFYAFKSNLLPLTLVFVFNFTYPDGNVFFILHLQPLNFLESKMWMKVISLNTHVEAEYFIIIQKSEFERIPDMFLVFPFLYCISFFLISLRIEHYSHSPSLFHASTKFFECPIWWNGEKKSFWVQFNLQHFQI